MFTVDADDPTPIYAQLERSIRMAVSSGRLSIGDQLPTVRQLAVDLRINANTVAKVYAALVRAGVVESRRGVGTFVVAAIPARHARPEHERALRAIEDRFLGELSTLGVSAIEAIEHLKKRLSRQR